MHLRVDRKTQMSSKRSHLRIITEQPHSSKYQQLVSTSAFIISRHKNIPINRAVKLAQNALESGEATRRFSNFK